MIDITIIATRLAAGVESESAPVIIPIKETAITPIIPITNALNKTLRMKIRSNFSIF